MASSTFRTISMPLGMVVGALFCRQIAWLDAAAQGMLTPVFIFTMLFITFCRVDARRIRFSWMHLWLLLFQVVASVGVYYSLAHFDIVVAQGAMICILAPVAMAAVVIGGMLGANLETMAAYSLLCNIAIALYAPLLLHAFGNGECTMAQILQKVSPLLIAPFVAGQFCRFCLRRVSDWVSAHGYLSFYIWLLSLIVIIGRTTCFLLDQTQASLTTEIILALVALIICLVQFVLGRYIGRHYGDTVAGGQSLGQKNTVLAVWLSQAFLDPISSVAPTAYIVWQNIVNSYQLWRAGRKS
ncbi:MAG: transporter [Alistipes sp.]|nr:transporter [Alistipes sp.]MBO5984255.1 transporter [Rikenellaceae bacterium]MBO7342433.1 transporter [Alistipes sp.]